MRSIIAIVWCCFALQAAELSGAHSVYLLPMTNGMDQYLANHLTGARVLQVVADAGKADVILTDRLGQSFEARMDELFPPPAPPKPKETGEDKDKAKDKEKDGPPAPGDTVNVLPPVGLFASTGRSKGNLFLVDAHSRRVLWSTFEKQGETDSETLDRTALRIVTRLKKALASDRKAAEPPAPAPAAPAPAAPAPAPPAPAKK